MIICDNMAGGSLRYLGFVGLSAIPGREYCCWFWLYDQLWCAAHVACCLPTNSLSGMAWKKGATLESGLFPVRLSVSR